MAENSHSESPESNDIQWSGPGPDDRDPKLIGELIASFIADEDMPRSDTSGSEEDRQHGTRAQDLRQYILVLRDELSTVTGEQRAHVQQELQKAEAELARILFGPIEPPEE